MRKLLSAAHIEKFVAERTRFIYSPFESSPQGSAVSVLIARRLLVEDTPCTPSECSTRVELIRPLRSSMILTTKNDVARKRDELALAT